MGHNSGFPQNQTLKLIIRKGGFIFGDIINFPLIVDRTDTKWLLLDRVPAVTTFRRAKQELARCGLTPVTNTDPSSGCCSSRSSSPPRSPLWWANSRDARISGGLLTSTGFLQPTRSPDSSAASPKTGSLLTPVFCVQFTRNRDIMINAPIS